MKPEQASKVKTWTPTRLDIGEGSIGRGSNRHTHRFGSTGVVGTACGKVIWASGGNPVRAEVELRRRLEGCGPAGVGEGHSTEEAG